MSDLAVHQLFVWGLSLVDDWVSDPSSRVLRLVLEKITSETDAVAIPRVLGRLPYAAGLDADRFDTVADLILGFDMYEAAEPLRYLINDGHIGATVLAAGLATHPGVPPGLADLVADRAVDLPTAERDLALNATEFDARTRHTRRTCRSTSSLARRLRHSHGPHCRGSNPRGCGQSRRPMAPVGRTPCRGRDRSANPGRGVAKHPSGLATRLGTTHRCRSTRSRPRLVRDRRKSGAWRSTAARPGRLQTIPQRAPF